MPLKSKICRCGASFVPVKKEDDCPECSSPHCFVEDDVLARDFKEENPKIKWWGRDYCF